MFAVNSLETHAKLFAGGSSKNVTAAKLVFAKAEESFGTPRVRSHAFALLC